jgi:histidyl-tRNA synthetase
MELINARGTRDIAPEEMIIRQKMIGRLRTVFELYGFSPLETPVIERFEILSAKYAGGAEILKETFSFKDQGGRELGLRYDLTVPFSRFVGTNPTLKMPFKRYTIGTVYRDGPIKAGRMREFVQCDVDVVGSSSMLADAQCIQIAQRFFGEIGLDVVVEVNSRKLLDGICLQAGIPAERTGEAILEIDKLKKIGKDEVAANLTKLGFEDDAVDKVISLFGTAGSNDEKIKKLGKRLTNATAIEGLNEVEEILSYVDNKNVKFNVALARGLSYYTGPVFEVFMKDEKLFSSAISAGGRYDKMISAFLATKRDYPAVGISFGIEPIMTVMKLLKKEAEGVKTVTKAYIIPINTTKECVKIAEELRSAGINTDMDLSGKGISKNLDYANVQGIPYVIIAGEDELKQKKVKLRDMKAGKEELLPVKDAAKMIGKG